MHWIDYSLLILYIVALLYLGFIKRAHKQDSAAEYILGSRTLTLPAFVASLVSTWYGGILGVGEYSYSYGISNWLVFGVPYYVAAFLFALFLAKPARETKLLTIPDRLAEMYDNKTAVTGAIIVFLMTVPAAYILMLGVLCEQLLGWPYCIGVIVSTFFSVVYIYTGGFRAVVFTDILQFVLMFLGFIGMIIYLVYNYGGLSFLIEHVPETHFTWHGGNAPLYIAIWYVIALATLIEPAFYQRCYAAKTPSVARNGIFWSIGFWCLFDFLTTFTGLYAKALIPDLAQPVASYPALAQLILPAGLMGLFALSLFVTVMSTVDSYAFISASTFSHDIIGRLKKTPSNVTRLTQIGLIITVVIAVGFAIMFRSAIDLWHLFGSIATPALLVPVVSTFLGKRRLAASVALVSIITSGALSGLWYLSSQFRTDGSYWLGIEPVLPGIALSLVIYLVFAKRYKQSPTV